MSDSDAAIERRLAAVERAVDGGPAPDGDSGDSGDDGDERGDADLEARVAALESRVDELDAAVQSVRGFLGGVSAVNESVERRADAAVAAVERLERRVDGDPSPSNDATTDGATAPASFDGGDHGTVNGVEDDEQTEQDQRGLRERLRELR